MAALPSLEARAPPSLRIALLGDPQTSLTTRNEKRADLGESITAIAALYGEERMVAPPVTGSSANVKAFRTLLATPEAEGCILHLACHGRFDREGPQTAPA